MNLVVGFIVLGILYLFAFATSFISCVFCKRAYTISNKLIKTKEILLKNNQILRAENEKLKKELYKKNFKVPEVDNVEESENGRK